MPAHRPGLAKLLLVPVALLVALAVLLTSALGYRYGEHAADELVGQLVAESTAGLNTHLHGFLDKAQLATGVAAVALQMGTLETTDLFQRPEAWFSAQHRLFPSVDDLYFGRSDGAIVGVDKADGRLLLKITTDFPKRSFFVLDDKGQRGQLLRTEDYDASKRDWYRSAVATGGPIWSKVYVLQNKDALGITAARPVQDRNGRLAGVAGANLTLWSISDYLKSHLVHGQVVAYVVEPDGALVATSSPDTPLAVRGADRARRVLAGDAAHPVIAASHRALQGQRSPPEAGPRGRAIDLQVDGQRLRVHQIPLKDGLGLNWQLVCAVDPEVHMASVRRVAQYTVLIGAVLLLLLMALVVGVTRRLARPIQSLSQAAGRVAQGEYGQTVTDLGGGREVGELISAFNDMSLALHGAIGKVVSQATRLEVEVANRTADLQAANQALALARDQAQSASLAKSDFMAHLSHEIRTPLSTIAGTCYLMRCEGLSPAQDQRVAALEAASQHLLGVVNAVLDLARMEAGKLELDDAPLWVQALVANVLSMVSGPAAAKQLALQSELPPLPDGLWGDRIRLQQMLLNYVANAVKFTPTGSVTVAVQVLASSDQDALLRFEVTDTGVPIAPEMLARLFMPFQQGQPAAGPPQASSGLGLAITRQLAEMMGGTAGAEAAPGGGNCFYFTVRLKRRDPQADAAPELPRQAVEAALRSGFQGARVLVAEDEPVNRLITQSMLRNVGLQADVAASGAEAVRLACERDYDLILMDMQMPDLDGVSAARQIRQSPRHAGTPIIATTANGSATDRLRCVQAGMNDFLTKPIDTREFFATLHRWLARA